MLLYYNSGNKTPHQIWETQPPDHLTEHIPHKLLKELQQICDIIISSED